MKKASWAEIPTIENLEIDWKYTPENPQGKRSSIRLLKKDLSGILEVDHIPVKIASKRVNGQGNLVDISTSGLAVMLDANLKQGLLIKLGFFLGKHKIISRGVVRNTNSLESGFRVGIEFVELDTEHASFIAGLNSSKIYRA